MNEDIKNYIDQRDTVTEQRIKLWIMSSIIAQVLTLAPIIFFLGGIYQSANTSLELLKAQVVVSELLAKRVTLIEDREHEMRSWAKTKGFRPFTPDPQPKQ